ncbi:MAG: amidohydrolase family protein [Candidatus Methylomirabilales bacterium]
MKSVNRVFPIVLAVLSLGVAPVPGEAQELPIFDAHIHYSHGDWDTLSPQQALALLDRAGVRQALVSSTPDDGTLKLYQADPKRIIPFLRPYRTRGDMGGWHSDPAVQAYVEERLTRGVYKGIGEFHLSAADTDKPVVKRLAELAAKQQLFLHAHVDEVAVERFLTLYPEVRILWAHAGMSSPVKEVGRLLDRYPKLWVELALRFDVAPGGNLDPEWRTLFLRHPDRFMVGTDTWTTSRWDSLVEETRATRRWLGQLPRDVADQIAYRNGERLFGRR